MILVIGSLALEAAPALVNMFPAGAACLLTASDLHRTFRCGVSVNDFASSRLLAGGRALAPAEISGVITAVPCFFPVEFHYVTPEDRDYVCAETNAFFRYLLGELDCRKCNPPDDRTLSGGALHRLEWMHRALRLGIPLSPFRLRNGADAPPPAPAAGARKCTVIFDEVVNTGPCPEPARAHARKLARALSLSYLDCHFEVNGDGEHALCGINAIPDLALAENRESLVRHFSGAAA